MLRLAERVDRSLLAVGHSLAGLPLLSVAEFAAARAHFERSIALYDFDRHRALAAEHGDDPGLTALAFLAIALWLTGHADQALARVREAQALAERLDAPYCRAFALSFAAWIHVRRGDTAAGARRVRRAASARRGARLPLPARARARSSAAGRSPRRAAPRKGSRPLRAGLAAQRAGGTEMGRPSHLALLADACVQAERTDEGLAAIEEALAIVAATGECAHEAELHRLKGELLARAGDAAAGDACLRHALALARRQGARSLELRAALGLARRRRGGRRDGEDVRMLRELVASFGEGFETADLRDARRAPRRAGAAGVSRRVFAATQVCATWAAGADRRRASGSAALRSPRSLATTS